MNIPRKVGVRLGICEGAIYIIKRQSDLKEHYYVVLNKNPLSDDKVILVSATTQHAKEVLYNEQNRFRRDTIVKISEYESKYIKQESTFNCVRATPQTLEDLEKSLTFKRVEYTGNIIERDILNRLQEATLRSTRLAKKHHKYLI